MLGCVPEHASVARACPRTGTLPRGRRGERRAASKGRNEVKARLRTYFPLKHGRIIGEERSREV